MPLIQVKLIENVFTPAQKSQIISKLTDAMKSIGNESMCPVMSVAIEEVNNDELGNGEQASISTDAAHAAFASFVVCGCF